MGGREGYIRNGEGSEQSDATAGAAADDIADVAPLTSRRAAAAAAAAAQHAHTSAPAKQRALSGAGACAVVCGSTTNAEPLIIRLQPPIQSKPT